MKLTPLDIQQVAFKVRMRGYDREEVDRFLDAVTQEFDNLTRDNVALREKLAELELQLLDLRKKESSLNAALLKAQDMAEEMRATAQKEAELIVREAEVKAEEVAQGAREEVAGARREVIDLRKQKTQAIERIRSLVQSVQRLLEVEEQSEEPLLDERAESARGFKPKS
jgi:cell division initiation protein